MKYLSLFSGIGGFELGIQQAYENILTQKTEKRTGEENEEIIRKQEGKINNERNKKLGDSGTELQQHSFISTVGQPTCIGYSEIDKYATQIYQKHFPTHTNYGDITTINADELPDFDFLCGGFPCQAFSIAGKRRGFEDTRGTLFFDIARILKAKKPRLLLLENVKGLLSHDNGKTFRTIITTLDELGYDLQWQVLNSKNFGVPQNRERVFIVGHLRGTPRPQVFPFREDNSEDIILPTITTRITADSNGTYVSEGQTQKTKSSRQIDGQKRVKPNNSDSRGGQTHTPSIRRLTPLECERLQGFPDNWTEGVSDTQRYKMCGNAVTVNVIQAIMEKLLSSN